MLLQALTDGIAISCDLLEPAEQIAVLPRQFDCLVDREPLVVGNLQASGHIQHNRAVVLLDAVCLALRLLRRKRKLSRKWELLRDTESLIGEFAGVQARERMAYAEVRETRRWLGQSAGLRWPLRGRLKAEPCCLNLRVLLHQTI